MDLGAGFVPSVSGKEGQTYVHRDIHVLKRNIQLGGLFIEPLLCFRPSLRVWSTRR